MSDDNKNSGGAEQGWNAGHVHGHRDSVSTSVGAAVFATVERDEDLLQIAKFGLKSMGVGWNLDTRMAVAASRLRLLCIARRGEGNRVAPRVVKDGIHVVELDWLLSNFSLDEVVDIGRASLRRYIDA